MRHQELSSDAWPQGKALSLRGYMVAGIMSTEKGRDRPALEFVTGNDGPARALNGVDSRIGKRD